MLSHTLSSLSKTVKKAQFIRFLSVPSLCHFTPYLSDDYSTSDDSEPTNNNSEIDNSNESVDIVNNLKGEPHAALLFFEKLKEEHGVRRNAEAYLAIVRILSYWGMDRKLHYVLLDAVKAERDGELFEAIALEYKVEGRASLFKVFDALVKVYVGLGMFDEAFGVLLGMRERDIWPSVLSCNYLLNRLVEKGDFEMVFDRYKQFKECGQELNVYTFGIVIKAYCRMGRLDEAATVFKDMADVGVEPDSYICSHFLDGLCGHGNANLAYERLQVWKANDVPIDGYCYTVVIRGFVREKKLEDAEKVLNEMKEMGLVLDERCYDALIRGYSEAGVIEKAKAFHYEMIAKGIRTNCVIISSILQCHCQMGNPSEAVDEFNDFKKSGVFLDGIAYNIAIDALSKMGKLEEAQSLMEEMKSKNMVVDIKHYTTLINRFCLAGKMGDAKRLFCEMLAKGLKPDLITYNVLAGGLAINGHAKEAFSVLDVIHDQDLDPSMETQNIMIEGLCTGGNVKEAERYFCSLKKKTASNYAAMINGYCEAKKVTEAYNVFRRSYGQGLIVNSNSSLKLINRLFSEGRYDRALDVFWKVSASEDGPCEMMYGKLIAALCSAGDMKKAQRLFDDMVSTGLSPDLYTYTRMMKGHCLQNRLQEALELFVEMKKRGLTPDIVAYTVLLDGHYKFLQTAQSRNDPISKNRATEMVSDLWSEIKTIDLIDHICYTALIDGLCKSDNLDDAIARFNEMSERGLLLDKFTYTSLFYGYCRQGHLGKAIALVKDMKAKGIESDSYITCKLNHIFPNGDWSQFFN